MSEMLSPKQSEDEPPLTPPAGAPPVGPVAHVVADPSGAPQPPVTETTVNRPTERSAQRSWSRDMLVSVAISLFIILFLYQPVRVEGTSMLPHLRDQDRLFINKFVYRFQSIHRGDVVVFLYPGDHTKSYIKRVIALPGDTLRIGRGTVYVNGHAIKEPYVPLRYRDDRSEPLMTIPKGEFFVYWPMDQVGVVH